MAKQLYTDFDVFCFKKALAQWARKNRFLVEKYEKLRDKYRHTDNVLENKCDLARADLLEEVLKDLRCPCDFFISQFEINNPVHPRAPKIDVMNFYLEFEGER